MYGEKLEQVREIHRWTQTELAQKVNVDRSMIAHVEANRAQPSPQLLDAIARCTGFLPAFFSKAPCAHFPLGSLQFRAKASMNASQTKEAHEYGRIIFEAAQEMAARIVAPPVSLRRMAGDPEELAGSARSMVGLSPDTPVPNLAHQLERAGVLVLLVPTMLDNCDAYSLWAGAPTPVPVVVLAGGRPGDRLRFTLAHELGELVLQEPVDRSREAAANQFAGAFLLPAQSMKREMTPPVTLSSLAAMKPKWGVSIQALARRAYDLEILKYRQWTYICQQINKRGWRMREPQNLDVPVERPRAFRKMAELLYGNPIDVRRFAKDMGWSTEFSVAVLGGYAERRARPASPQADGPKVVPFIRPSERPGG